MSFREFFWDYGWAIIVVLVVSCALVYFGILNPPEPLDEKYNETRGIEPKTGQVFCSNDYNYVSNIKLSSVEMDVWVDTSSVNACVRVHNPTSERQIVEIEYGRE